MITHVVKIIFLVQFLVACQTITTDSFTSEKECMSEPRFELLSDKLEEKIRRRLNYDNYISDIVQFSMFRMVSKEDSDSDVIRMIDKKTNLAFRRLKESYDNIEDFEPVRSLFERHIQLMLRIRNKKPSMLGNEAIDELAKAIGYPQTFKLEEDSESQ